MTLHINILHQTKKGCGEKINSTEDNFLLRKKKKTTHVNNNAKISSYFNTENCDVWLENLEKIDEFICFAQTAEVKFMRYGTSLRQHVKVYYSNPKIFVNDFWLLLTSQLYSTRTYHSFILTCVNHREWCAVPSRR